LNGKFTATTEWRGQKTFTRALKTRILNTVITNSIIPVSENKVYCNYRLERAKNFYKSIRKMKFELLIM
jgi:hypothetical protein